MSRLSPQSDTGLKYNESKSSKAFCQVKAAPGALASARAAVIQAAFYKGWLKD